MKIYTEWKVLSFFIYWPECMVMALWSIENLKFQFHGKIAFLHFNRSSTTLIWHLFANNHCHERAQNFAINRFPLLVDHSSFSPLYQSSNVHVRDPRRGFPVCQESFVAFINFLPVLMHFIHCIRMQNVIWSQFPSITTSFQHPRLHN